MGARGLIVTDCTGVLTGNSDLDCCDQGWSGVPKTADGSEAPLPGYPTGTWPTCSPVSDKLPSPKVEALKDVAAIVALLALGGVGGWLLRGAPL